MPSPQTVNFGLRQLNAAHITLGQKIAEGHFAVVYTGKLLSTDIAIKTFKDNIQNIEGVQKELRLIQ
jgi:hypothetical protein